MAVNLPEALQSRSMAGREGELTAATRFGDAAVLWLVLLDHALTTTERIALVEQLQTDEPARRRDLPDLVFFMLATGARIGEALAVLWSNVDLDEGTISIGQRLGLARPPGRRDWREHLDPVGEASSRRRSEPPQWGILDRGETTPCAGGRVSHRVPTGPRPAATPCADGRGTQGRPVSTRERLGGALCETGKPWRAWGLRSRQLMGAAGDRFPSSSS